MSENNVTKAEIIESIMNRTGFSKTEAKVAFDAVVDSIVEYVSEGQRIELRGFGVFNNKTRQPRRARNPKTGEEVLLESKAVPYFKPSPDFQRKVNDSLNASNKKS